MHLTMKHTLGAFRLAPQTFHFFRWLSFFFVLTTTTPLSSLGVVKSSKVCTLDNTLDYSSSKSHTAGTNSIVDEIGAMNIPGLGEDDRKFLERVQSSVKTVLHWEEDVELLKACRSQIPWNELADPQGPYSNLSHDRLLQGDALFLQRLCRWFQKFMNWVNTPPCQACGCTDCEFKTVRGPETEEEKEGGAKRVEVYYCPQCDANTTTFPRYNKAQKLLETKKGRCGEYSNLFGLFCRSVGLETRLVLDLSDHLWTEVWLGDSWVMADGCEGIIDKLSMYEYGWGKKELCYMIGICNDHIVDVTPRYTRQYMTDDFQNRRRTHTSSEQVSEQIFDVINQQLQQSLPKSRLNVLRSRHKAELIELQLFKQATEWTPQEKYGRGRISGSLAWKRARQEDGKTTSDGNNTTEEQVAGFEVEAYVPPLYDDKLSFVVKPNPTSRHDAIIVASTPCAIGENDSVSVVVVDEAYLGCILQSQSFLTWSDTKNFIDRLPAHRIVLVNGRCEKHEESKDGGKTNPEESKMMAVEMPRLGGWKGENVMERGVVFVGQVDAHPDWSFCTTVEDCSKEGHEIVLRITEAIGEKQLRTEKQTLPQRVAGRLPESVMPLKTQLLASDEQKRLAFTSFHKSSANTSRYSGYTTKRNAPVYLLDATSYPFHKMDPGTIEVADDVWNTFHFLPPALVPNGDSGILSSAQPALPKFDVPLEVDFFQSSLGTQLLGQNNARLQTPDALRNARLIGLYFSAHWCGPCRSFTPMLAEMYEHLKDVRPTHGLEIVFVSSDRDPGSFQQYCSTMPWLAIPYETLPFVKQSLNTTYGVRGIPSLVVLDALSGRVVVPPDESRQAVAMACRSGEHAIESMLESWLERMPQDSREMLSMLELSCEEEVESQKVDDKVIEYLVAKEKDSNPRTVDTAARIKEIFEKLVGEGSDPTAAAAKAIAMVGEEQGEQRVLDSGPLNGKAIQIGPHKSYNTLDQAFTTFVERNSQIVAAEVLSTTLKYLKNASKEPWTPKYRTFKLSNKVADQITRAEGALGLLQGLGFDVFGTSQDFKATIPVSSDLDAMIETLTSLVDSIATQTSGKRLYRRASPLYLGTKTAAKGSTDETNVVNEKDESDPMELQKAVKSNSEFSYVDFAKNYPFANNLMIATAKTAAADLLAQTVIAQMPLSEVDLQRSFLFCLFGCLYIGAFQYLYQVQVFKKLFDVDKFTSQSWSDKLKDIPGLKALGAQTGLDLTILTFVYLPTFYIFKASVFSGSMDPSVWFSSGFDTFQSNFQKDEADLIKVWLPSDLVCFSVPLYLRLPVRHVVSFVWTAYLSFYRGGH